MPMMREFARLQLDISIAQQEFLLGLAARPFLNGDCLPDGDGRAVLLLPGFGANETLLKRLHGYLGRNGYQAEMFIPGFPQKESLSKFIDSISKHLSQRISSLKKQTGNAVSLVGQSAGGLYSREFARQHPADVDRVITLGSPTFYPENQHLQNQALSALIERRFGTSTELAFSDDRFVHWEKESPAIPYVAIYSPIDGAVRAETVVIPDSQLNVSKGGAIRENIAIRSSHFGMVLNPFVMLAIVDRLGADPSDWQAFDPRRRLPRALRSLSSLVYPDAGVSENEIPSMTAPFAGAH